MVLALCTQSFRAERQIEKQRLDDEVDKLDADADFLKDLLAPTTKREKGERKKRMADGEEGEDGEATGTTSAAAVKTVGYDDLLSLIAKQERVARASESQQEIEKRAFIASIYPPYLCCFSFSLLLCSSLRFSSLPVMYAPCFLPTSTFPTSSNCSSSSPQLRPVSSWLR